MADPFKKAAARATTSLRRDAQGPYWSVELGGGGGEDAPAPGEPVGDDDGPLYLDDEALEEQDANEPEGDDDSDDTGAAPREDWMQHAQSMPMSMPMNGMMLAENEKLPVVDRMNPTIMDRIKRWFTSSGDEVQPASRDVAEGINEALPESMSGNEAVKRRRELMRRYDEATQGT